MNASRARSRRTASRPTRPVNNSAPTSCLVSRSGAPIMLRSYSSPANTFFACSATSVTRSRRTPSAAATLEVDAVSDFDSLMAAVPAAITTAAAPEAAAVETASGFTSAGLTVGTAPDRSEEHTSELQSHHDLVCRLLLEKKKQDKA